MSPEIRQELERLFSALCNGELSSAEHARLEHLLATSAEFRRFYLEYMDLHANLFAAPTFSDGAPEAPTPAGSGSKKVRQVDARGAIWTNLRQALLIGGTLAASAVIQVFWLHPEAPQQRPMAEVRLRRGPLEREQSDPFVATLRQTINCVWDNPPAPLQIGSRLAPGELRLPKGVASILFDSGSELLMEGPAHLRLESSTAATVLSGKVVFRADDSAVPFELRTPGSSLADFGEYAVAVSPDEEEVHVFAGEVERTLRTGASTTKPEHLKAGEARRYGGSTYELPKMTKLDPTHFVRHISAPTEPQPDQATGLLAYESFNYQTGWAATSARWSGGLGWVGPWKSMFLRSFPEEQRRRSPFNVKENLTRLDDPAAANGGSFDHTGFAKFARRLAQPVRMDSDTTYYLSFLFRRDTLSKEPFNGLGVVFWTLDDFQHPRFENNRKQLSIGVKAANQVYVRHQRMDDRTSLPLNPGVTYLLVAKIAASKSDADRVFVRVFGPEEALTPDEPDAWPLKSASFRSDLSLELLQLQISGKTRQTMDELRLGSTWASVTAPWIQK